MNEQEIQQKRRENEENATRDRARILGLPYLDTRSFEDTIPLVMDLISKTQMHTDYILPLQKGGNEEHYQFMVTSQTPRSVIEKIGKQYADFGEKCDFFLISLSGYNIFMLRYDPPREIHYEDIRIAKEGDSETLAEVSQTLNSVGTEKVFDFLLDQADKLGASDIHIENLRDAIRIRMRVDGMLHPVANIERDRYRVFMGELSSRAGVSTAAQTPQSGHMQKDVFSNGAKHLLNIRVETIPTMYGQDAVLRLFNFDESLLNLDLLGLTREELDTINEVVSHPRGLVLMVGPTGSGKSTTLYSMINALNSTERKIITLEDPIEYGINGVSQIPIDTTNGGSFADGLRSVLRLDPDVVMVGEIRDADTAKTAIQASITGHLVLSSFHANSTAAAFSRMIDLIGTNPIFSSSVRLVIAQRLLRKLSDSKQEYEPDEATRKYVLRILSGLSNELISEKIGKEFNPESFTLYKAVPNGEEDPFGYKGRIVIMEQMLVSEGIQKFIRGDMEDINTDAIEKTAKELGMITLEQKGVLAALRGETTIDEVGRVL